MERRFATMPERDAIEFCRTMPAYNNLNGAQQQAIDLWIGDRISWHDVPTLSRAFLGRMTSIYGPLEFANQE